jgi:hypothetical protein
MREWLVDCRDLLLLVASYAPALTALGGDV